MKILESASKIVFLLITIAVIALTFMRIVEAKDFLVIAGMVFTYYFAHKGDNSNNYLGK
jgi:uncharacterized membrane protein